jgi:hypothetical protein
VKLKAVQKQQLLEFLREKYGEEYVMLVDFQIGHLPYNLNGDGNRSLVKSNKTKNHWKKEWRL